LVIAQMTYLLLMLWDSVAPLGADTIARHISATLKRNFKPFSRLAPILVMCATNAWRVLAGVSVVMESVLALNSVTMGTA